MSGPLSQQEPAPQASRPPSLSARAAGLAFALAVHALFAWMVWHLFWFLRGEPTWARPGPWWPDVGWALVFAVPHSLLLLPSTRRRLARWLPAEFFGLVFCLASAVTLLLLMAAWRTSDVVLIELRGPARTAVLAGFYGSWVLMFYSMALTGLGYQTGITPFWHWFRGRTAPRREFRPTGLYRLLRHPVYLSFLGVIWLTPTVTLDRAVLIAVWTGYVCVGSYLKDERLAYYLGESYRAYQRAVPGYPLVPWGPLARRSTEPAAVGELPATGLR